VADFLVTELQRDIELMNAPEPTAAAANASYAAAERVFAAGRRTHYGKRSRRAGEHVTTSTSSSSKRLEVNDEESCEEMEVAGGEPPDQRASEAKPVTRE